LNESSLQEIMCCVGHPVAGYPAQYMMEKCFADSGLDCRYLTLDVEPEKLGEAIRGMRAMGFRGAHFTAPHKEAVLEHVEHLTEVARVAGLANLVYRDDEGVYVGANTNGEALCQLLDGKLKLPGKHVVLLGAGTVARAVAVALAMAGVAEVTIVNRSDQRGQQLLDLLNEKTQVSAMFFPWTGDYEIPAETDLLVNTTSIEALDPDARLGVVTDSLSAQTIVADFVYNPPRTRFLRSAADRGCTTINGPQLLVQQGVIAFKTWTGVTANADVMREALEEFLEL
jgi:shikimate dehydrogenase